MTIIFMWQPLAYMRHRFRREQTDFCRPAGESIIDWHVTRFRDRPMEFTALFLATAIVMLVAWRGPRPLAAGLFAAVLIACVATYLHHATNTLKLSF